MKKAIVMDAGMSAFQALERLALNGYWLDADHPAVRGRLQALARDSDRPLAEVAALLARPADRCGVAIRRQWGPNILWYPKEVSEVLLRCMQATPDTLLVDALELNESDSKPVIDLTSGATLATGVVMLSGQAVGVSFAPPGAAPPIAMPVIVGDLTLRSGEDRSPYFGAPAAERQLVQAWPRLDAPQQVAADARFEVVVGFGAERQAGIASSPLRLPVMAGSSTVRVAIELSAAQGVASLDGWSRTVDVAVADPGAAEARFPLVGVEPENTERLWLTMLEARYVVDGVVCGLAARPLMVLPRGSKTPPPAQPFGTRWSDVPTIASPVDLRGDPNPPDLTIEISEPSGNVAAGTYVCRLYSPHALQAERGPFEIKLGQDSATFARQIVDDMRVYSGTALLDFNLESIGKRIAGRLPPSFFAALREIHTLRPAGTPSVLIVSREPYVPWELAWVEDPLEPTRPSYLGAQALVGRWLRGDGKSVPSDDGAIAARPAMHPRSTLGVSKVAVMSAYYKPAGLLRRLPKAEEEAAALAQSHPVVALRATAGELRRVLKADVRDAARNPIGGIDVFHFAGHGDFDPGAPDGSALFLEDGVALRSNLFGAAHYGGERQPFLFLNACMLGIGGDVLGDMGGFPGSSLRGGFGAVLGALWEIDDDVAHDIALEFWQRVLPPAPTQGEPVGAVLRDLRARYVADAEPSPVSTYLSYVYYGHPCLKMQRTA